MARKKLSRKQIVAPLQPTASSASWAEIMGIA